MENEGTVAVMPDKMLFFVEAVECRRWGWNPVRWLLRRPVRREIVWRIKPHLKEVTKKILRERYGKNV